MEGAPWGPAGERAGGGSKPGGVGVQENCEDRASGHLFMRRCHSEVAPTFPPSRT